MHSPYTPNPLTTIRPAAMQFIAHGPGRDKSRFNFVTAVTIPRFAYPLRFYVTQTPSPIKNYRFSHQATVYLRAMQKQTAKKPNFQVLTSRGFTSWLASQKTSFAFSTYQTGKLFLVGIKRNGKLSIFSRNFGRAMGLWGDGQTLYLSTQFQLWRFENYLNEGQFHGDYDRLYVPVQSHVTGDIDIHDVAVDENGRVVFLNTLFSCLATTSPTQSFEPLWQPPFISDLQPEDRCHLNGLALRDGRPAFATSTSRSDVAIGWRDRRWEGGLLIDIEQNEIIMDKLSMPHSPRWYRGDLYVLNSGTGYFGKVDLDTREFIPLTFCPGFMRGLSFIGDYAIVGISKPRNNKTFTDLPLDANLKKKDADARCGLCVIDLNNGGIVQWLHIEGAMGEMYDVVTLPNVVCPTALGFKTDEIARTIKLGNRHWIGQNR